MLGVEAPILQSGMGGVAGPELASAVCNAGGLGVLAALNLAPDAVRAGIDAMRASTSRPFGVNIWLHYDVRSPPDPAALPTDIVRGAQDVLNEFRPRFDLALRLDGPPAMPDLIDAALEVMIAERIPVFSAGLGVPEAELVERFHRVGTRVVCMVATVEDGEAAAGHGVDVVVAQGSEAGGHRSFGAKHPRPLVEGDSTFVLVPRMCDAIGDQVPVVAAGGIVDGRGLASMLVLGADGVLLGTRFVATHESMASDLWKRRLTTGARPTTLTDGFTGQWARVLSCEFADRWAESGVDPPPGLLQAALGADLFAAARSVGDDQHQPLYAGAGVAGISDLVGAGEVVTRLVAEADELLTG